MKRSILQRTGLILGAASGAAALAIIPASALAQTTAASTNSTGQARIQRIINRGNNEISRRLSNLNTLSSKISSTTKLSTDDKAALSAEVTDEINGLTSLKSKLDADTTLTAATADAQSIISDYRVYALVLPKVNLVKTADDQQVAESKLSSLASKLQSRLSTDQSAGDNVTSLQNGLKNMTTEVNDAQVTSKSIESTVINLQPSDYNSDHSILSGDRNKLKTAQNDIQSAVGDARTIINGLTNL